MKERALELAIDYDAIIAAHLARQPSRIWPGLRFTIPMDEDQWSGFPQMPSWKYEWDIRLGADTQIRPFGPRYCIRVEWMDVTAPYEIRSVKRRDLPALRQAFATAFTGYTDYIFCTEIQLLRLGGSLLRELFGHTTDHLCRRASCLALDPDCPGRIIGAALLAPSGDEMAEIPPESATRLQPVFVVPEWRRRGVATALVSEVLRRLWDAGQETLISGCSDYNLPSKRWHLAFGMREEQRYYSRLPLFRWARSELWRREYLEKTRGIPFESLERTTLERSWMALADELDMLERDQSWFDQRRGSKRTYREEVSRYLEARTMERKVSDAHNC